MTALDPDAVRMNRSANGAAGRAWLGSLPGLVEELTDRVPFPIVAGFNYDDRGGRQSSS